MICKRLLTIQYKSCVPSPTPVLETKRHLANRKSHPEVVCEFLVAVERAGGAVDDQFREAVILSDSVQAMDGPEVVGLIATTSMR